ncbi:hypothetical protein [Polymorphobacter sp.]|uniref:hypothetical protein n=1 Tax=Polymorphobacter sp. TaxID=1909290 RepID=UPI003F72FCC7
MRPMLIATTALFAAGLAAAPLAAQQAAAPAAVATATANDKLVVGATVKDTAGGVVGTIDAVEANSVIVNTGTNQVAIPPSSFGQTPDGPLLAATKAELDGAANSAAAADRTQINAMLTNGTPVIGAEGQPIGTVDIVENNMVLIKTETGEAQVPADSFMLKDGKLAIGMTAEAFAAAVEAARAGS